MHSRFVSHSYVFHAELRATLLQAQPYLDLSTSQVSLYHFKSTPIKIFFKDTGLKSRNGSACTFRKTHLLTFIVIFDWAPLAAKACFVFIQSICPLHKYLQHIPSNIYLLIYAIEKSWTLGNYLLGLLILKIARHCTFKKLTVTISQFFGSSTSMSSDRPLNPYWQFSGAWARPIYGKLIQSSIIEFWGTT